MILTLTPDIDPPPPSRRADVRKMIQYGLNDWRKKRIAAITPDMVERR